MGGACDGIAGGLQAENAAGEGEEGISIQAGGLGTPGCFQEGAFVGGEEGERGVAFTWGVGQWVFVGRRIDAENGRGLYCETFDATSAHIELQSIKVSRGNLETSWQQQSGKVPLREIFFRVYCKYLPYLFLNGLLFV